MEWHGLDAAERSRLAVAEGSIDLPRLGLSSADYEALLDTVSEIIHCASDTSFSERKREAVERTNCHGMLPVLDLALKGRCVYFHYVSTAYAAGKRAGICEEDLVENDAFTNVYEETKYRAERIAFEPAARRGSGLPSTALHRVRRLENRAQHPIQRPLLSRAHPLLSEGALPGRHQGEGRPAGARHRGSDGRRRRALPPIRVAVAESGG